MPQQYAAKTRVAIMQTRQEILEELRAMGATKCSMPEDDDRGMVAVHFQVGQVQYAILMGYAHPNEERFKKTPTGRWRDSVTATEQWEQDCVARWRALGLYIKAVRVAAETGITKVETLLLPHAIIPSTGQTVEQFVAPQLAEAYTHGTVPTFLPGSTPLALPSPVTVVDEDGES